MLAFLARDLELGHGLSFGPVIQILLALRDPTKSTDNSLFLSQSIVVLTISPPLMSAHLFRDELS